MQLPTRRENHGFSMFCQFGNLANSLLFTVYSEGSHVDSRVPGHAENSQTMIKNYVRIHEKCIQKQDRNVYAFLTEILMIFC